MSRRLSLALTIGAACLALAAVGCSSDDSTKSNTPTSPASTSSTSTSSTNTPGSSSGTPSTSLTGTPGATGTPSSTSTIPEVTITARDFAYDMPDTVAGGLVRFTLKNTGKESHQATIVKLKAGVTADQFQTALKNPDPAASLPLVDLAGGPNTVMGGATQSVLAQLTPGQYYVLCFVSGEDDIPHLAKGMIKPFTVTAPPANASTTPPAKDATVTLADFNFLGVDSLPADKKTTLQVTNGGPQPHELTIVKLGNGVTVDTLKAALANPAGAPPDVQDAGGISALSVNATSYVDLTLKAGNYVFLCFVPDQKTGQPHAALGMIKAITVK